MTTPDLSPCCNADITLDNDSHLFCTKCGEEFETVLLSKCCHKAYTTGADSGIHYCSCGRQCELTHVPKVKVAYEPDEDWDDDCESARRTDAFWESLAKSIGLVCNCKTMSTVAQESILNRLAGVYESL